MFRRQPWRLLLIWTQISLSSYLGVVLLTIIKIQNVITRIQQNHHTAVPRSAAASCPTRLCLCACFFRCVAKISSELENLNLESTCHGHRPCCYRNHSGAANGNEAKLFWASWQEDILNCFQARAHRSMPSAPHHSSASHPELRNTKHLTSKPKTKQHQQDPLPKSLNPLSQEASLD